MKEAGKPLIQTIFLTFLWAAILLTLAGGIYYLSQHGTEKLNIKAPSGIIMSGILVLLLSQLVRIALVAWYYFNLRELKYVGFSLFILGILIFSLFWA